MMQRALRPSALVTRGFDVESAVCDGAATSCVRAKFERRLTLKSPVSLFAAVHGSRGQ